MKVGKSAIFRKTLFQIKKHWELYFFISIFAVISILFGIYPMISSIFYSFYKTNTVLTVPVWVGIKNYINLFQDEYFWNSVRSTIIFTAVSVPLNMLIALLLAQLLNYKGIKKGQLFFKLAVFIPVITPDVVGAVVWKQFFNSQGAMNQLLGIVGLDPVRWLTQPTTATGVLVFVELWKHVGLYTIIFLTNYQLIDTSLFEAANIDGANAWQLYFHIILPALKPAFTLNMTYSIIQFLKTYTVSRIITFGGPNYATNFLSYYAYSKYEGMNFGSATAIATLLFVFICIVTIIGTRIGNRHETLQ